MTDGALIDLLLDQTERLIGVHVDRDLLCSVEQGVWPQALWAEMDALGRPDALVVPAAEEGLTFRDGAALFALLGAHATPAPIGETILARMLLAHAGLATPEGPLLLCDDAGPQSPGLAFARNASHIIVGRAGRLHLYPVNQADCPAISSLSREPYGRVEIETLTSAADADWPQSLPGTAVLGAMLRSSQIAGAIAQVLALSVDYAQIRKQFGKQIGRFQAVQQMLAELAAEAAAARSCADAAWAALDQGGSVEAVAAVAKVRTAKAARTAAAIAHQVHGAIGVTDEYILHYHTRRLWQWRLDFGGEAIWAERLGAAHRDSGCDLWTFLITRCCPAAPTEAISC